jgi:hypothetical protein
MPQNLCTIDPEENEKYIVLSPHIIKKQTHQNQRFQLARPNLASRAPIPATASEIVKQARMIASILVISLGFSLQHHRAIIAVFKVPRFVLTEFSCPRWQICIKPNWIARPLEELAPPLELILAVLTVTVAVIAADVLYYLACDIEDIPYPLY